MQHHIDTTAPAQTGDQDEEERDCEPLLNASIELLQVRAGWMQALPGTPQTTPRGEFGACLLVHTLVVFCALIWAVAGFRESQHSCSCDPVKKLLATFQLPSSSA